MTRLGRFDCSSLFLYCFFLADKCSFLAFEIPRRGQKRLWLRHLTLFYTAGLFDTGNCQSLIARRYAAKIEIKIIRRRASDKWAWGNVLSESLPATQTLQRIAMRRQPLDAEVGVIHKPKLEPEDRDVLRLALDDYPNLQNAPPRAYKLMR